MRGGAKGQREVDFSIWDYCYPTHSDSGYDELMLGEFQRL